MRFGSKACPLSGTDTVDPARSPTESGSREFSGLQSPYSSSPSLMTIDIEMDKALARIDSFAIEAGDFRRGSQRGKKPSPVSSPLKTRLSNVFKRKGGRPKALTQPLDEDDLKKLKVPHEKTDVMLREAYTIVRAPPRAILKRHSTNSSKQPRSPRTQPKPSLFSHPRSPTAQTPSSVRQKLPSSPETRNNVEYHPEAHQFNTPVSRQPNFGNILEFSTVSRSVKFNGTPVSHSRQSNFTVNSRDGVRSPKVKVKMSAMKTSPRSSVSKMMKNLKCQMESQSKEDDGNESDTSTIHLLTFDELAQKLVCESNEQERLDDPCIPPTLTITTSRMSTTSMLGASTTSFLGDSGFMGWEKDPPTAPPPPILRETKSTSSVHTLKWSTYNKYYDGQLSPPPPLRERWSNGSRNKPEAVQSDPAVKDESFLAPPLVSSTSISYLATPSIEVVPGHAVAIRGADETLLYVAADATAEKSLITTNQCMTCTSTFHCVWDAEFMLCPICRTVQPGPTDDDDTQGWGVGLGFLSGDWESWKNSLAASGL